MNKFPQFAGAVPIDDRTALDLLKGSEPFRKIFAEQSTHVIAFRKTAAGKIAKIEADAESKFPKMRIELENAIREAREAEMAWRGKADRAYEIQVRMSAESSLHGIEMSKLETQLAETASPEISIFLADMRALWEDCFKAFDVNTETETVNQITRRRERRVRNNSESLLARQEAIRDAQAAAEAMRLEPDQSTVSVRLQELRNNLPAIAAAR